MRFPRYELAAGLALCASVLLCACSGGKSNARTYQLGERVELGHIVYTVYETQWLPQIGEGMSARVPQNRFFLIRISAADTSGGELYIPPITIENDSGQSYNELSNGDGIPQWVGLVRRVQPVEPLQGNIAFDAPAAHYRLLLSGDGEGQTAYVDIPLNYETETPVQPFPAPEKK